MKLLFAFFSIGFLLIGCLPEPNHLICIKNEYSETVNNLKVGSVSFGNVNSGSTTEYKTVEEGTNLMSGTTTSGQSLNCSASVTGMGTHKWTMTILSSGGIKIEENK